MTFCSTRSWAHHIDEGWRLCMACCCNLGHFEWFATSHFVLGTYDGHNLLGTFCFVLLDFLFHNHNLSYSWAFLFCAHRLTGHFLFVLLLCLPEHFVLLDFLFTIITILLALFLCSTLGHFFVHNHHNSTLGRFCLVLLEFLFTISWALMFHSKTLFCSQSLFRSHNLTIITMLLSTILLLATFPLGHKSTLFRSQTFLFTIITILLLATFPLFTISNHHNSYSWAQFYSGPLLLCSESHNHNNSTLGHISTHGHFSYVLLLGTFPLFTISQSLQFYSWALFCSKLFLCFTLDTFLFTIITILLLVAFLFKTFPMFYSWAFFVHNHHNSTLGHFFVHNLSYMFYSGALGHFLFKTFPISYSWALFCSQFYSRFCFTITICLFVSWALSQLFL